MQKIRLLSDFEIGCIAAGEVVENPGSIIKELIENSIDSKASEIKIYFTQGGIEEIVVVDNGCGMSREDLSLALLPHATSKLPSIDELYFKNNIFFGFRGEALSAISVVSRTSVISREKNAPYGFSVTSDHGKLFPIEEVASNFGTTVIVKNLFEKVPVRKKYLNSIKSQEKNIIYIITGLVLSHPAIHFIIYKDNKLYKEYKPALGFISRSYQVVSAEQDKYLVIDYQDIYFKLEGVISFYENGYYDRSKMFILANGRLIKQYKITQSCLKAYNSDNFAKKYPELCLSITVSPDQIDVNVHPRKEEVLFLYQKKIEQLLTEVLVKVLESRTKEIFAEKINYFVDSQAKFVKHSNEISDKEDCFAPRDFQLVVEEPNKNDFQSLLQNDFLQNNTQIEKEGIDNQNDEKKAVLEKESCFAGYQQKAILESLPLEIKIQTELFIQKKQRVYLGILADTYILLLENSSLIFVDQHALHEKILYEEFIDNFKKAKTMIKQPLLFDEKIIINEEQKQIFTINRELFNSIGIFYDIFADLIVVKSYPINFLKFDMATVLLDYCVLLLNNSEKSFEQKQTLVLHEMAALYGCKNAIKAGDKIDHKEVDLLLKSIETMHNGTFCPHGRPVYYQMELNYIHALFKRI
jgi:DNA mismatch repair protein MutL